MIIVLKAFIFAAWAALMMGRKVWEVEAGVILGSHGKTDWILF